jgi:hypothetical protein
MTIHYSDIEIQEEYHKRWAESRESAVQCGNYDDTYDAGYSQGWLDALKYIKEIWLED